MDCTTRTTGVASDEVSGRLDGVGDVGETGDGPGWREGDGEEVDTPVGVSEVRVCCKKRLSGVNEAAGLGGGDRLFGGAEAVAAPGFHLDEDEDVTVAHDQVELAAGKAPVCGLERVAEL